MKYVQDTSAGQSISAYVILRPDRKQTAVATVRVHYSNAGVVTVDVFNYGLDNPSAGFKQGKAGGYGYDKFTAALAGLLIDGFEMMNPCRPGPRRRKDVQGANWSKELDDWASWFYAPGLDRLKARGYRVLQAI